MCKQGNDHINKLCNIALQDCEEEAGSTYDHFRRVFEALYMVGGLKKIKKWQSNKKETLDKPLLVMASSPSDKLNSGKSLYLIYTTWYVEKICYKFIAALL